MDDLAIKTYSEDIIVHVDGISVPVTAPATFDKPIYQLLYAANVGGEFVKIIGGTYVWAVVADNFNGATTTLQVLGPDGATVLDVVSTSENASFGVYVGEGTPMRVSIFGGPPTRVYSDLRAYLT